MPLKIDRKRTLHRMVDGVLTPCRMSELNAGDVVTLIMPDGHQTTFTISYQIKMTADARKKMREQLKKQRPKRPRIRPEPPKP
jgi:hypothetical protein